MERYAIYAYEAMYGGRHGIYDVTVMKGSLKEAEDEANRMSLEVMDNYSFFYDEFAASAEAEGYEEGTDEFDEHVQECYDENTCYEIKRIREDVPFSDRECEEFLYEDPKDFFETYCE